MNDPEQQIDRLLQQPAAQARDLASGILERIHEPIATDELIEETLDHLLAAQPASPRDQFTEVTLKLARSSKRDSSWKSFTQTISLLAACLAVTFLLPQTVKNTHTPVTQANFETSRLIDDEIVTLLALADDLPQNTRWLLEDVPLLTLLTESE
jgi:hypothetical protein